MDLNGILVVLVIGYMSLASPEASGSKYNERNPENHIGYGLASPEASGSKCKILVRLLIGWLGLASPEASGSK